MKKIKQFLKRVFVRKTTLTNLIINLIRYKKSKIAAKKHMREQLNINKLTLFLPKNYYFDSL